MRVVTDCASHNRRRPLAALALLLVSMPVVAAGMSARQIVERAASRYDVVKDYTVNARISVESPTVHMPESKLTIYYKHPDKVHIDSKDGFMMIPKQGLAVGNPLREMVSGSNLSIQGSRRFEGKDCYLIRAESDRNGRAVEATIWIDKGEYLARRVTSNPDYGPSVDMRVSYTKVANRYWLPAMTRAVVAIPPVSGAKPQAGGPAPKPTVVTLKFSGYKVNTGLDDKLFAKREGSK